MSKQIFPLAFILASCVADVLVGCASVQPLEKPLGAIELLGRVTEVAGSPYYGLSAAQNAGAMVAGGYALTMLASAIDARSGNREVKSIVVTTSSSLSLTLPVNGHYQPGECVRLFVDSIFTDILSRQNLPNMSLPTGSTYIQKVAC